MIDAYPNIQAVGVELEGLWTRPGCTQSGCHYPTGDGSLHFQSIPMSGWVGEYRMGPFTSWAAAKEKLTSHWPDRVNRTCGLHVHVSLTQSGLYTALMTERFYAHMLSSLRRFARIHHYASSSPMMARLRGENSYCAIGYSDDAVYRQANTRGKGGERYNAVNFCKALHGTVEIRVLPATASALRGLRSIDRVLRTINRYLSLPGAATPVVTHGAAEFPNVEEEQTTHFAREIF